jgi:SAM-dependent methyltransferase
VTRRIEVEIKGPHLTPEEAAVALAEAYGPEFFEGRSETVERSAAVVVPILCELLEPTSVLDLGCGQGEWLAALAAAGIEEAIGVDITREFPSALPFGYVRHDLTQPFDLGGLPFPIKHSFDLALCLEVGEHLPEESAGTLVDTITRHADTVVFSAAVPGQEGTGHINCQPHEYWHAKFAARGYEMRDEIRPLIQDERVSPWYRDNIYLYRASRLR